MVNHLKKLRQYVGKLEREIGNERFKIRVANTENLDQYGREVRERTIRIGCYQEALRELYELFPDIKTPVDSETV